MSRKKREIEFVENKDARNVIFSKRIKDIFKKAIELSVLCNARVCVLGFTPDGNPFAFSSPNIGPYENENIMINKQNMGVTEELEKVMKIDKGKFPIDLADLDLKELLKVKASLQELRGVIEAASSLLLLAKKPM